MAIMITGDSASASDDVPSKRQRVDDCYADVHDANETKARKILPVTLLSGFLGAGKTTLLKQILQSKQHSNLKIAIIVNDMGSINLDASEIKKHKLIQEKAEMVEMHNGCICCTLRGDLLKTVKALAEEDKYDYLVIESTGISEPLPVAQTFVMDVDGEEGEDADESAQKDEGDSPSTLSEYARMDTLVTVIDTYNFTSILGTIESESDRVKYFGNEEDGEGEKTDESEESIVKLLIDQIEFANVILLNKIDLLKETPRSSVHDQIIAIRAIVQKLNPKAKIVVPEKPKFDGFHVDQIINTNMFDMDEAQESAGWIAELEKPYHTPETEEYGIGSFVFRNSERPFHPQRLARILKSFGTSLVQAITSNEYETDSAEIFSRVVRCKGEIWLSNADSCPIDVHSVGRQLVLTPAGSGRPWMGKVLECHPNGDAASDEATDEDVDVWSSFDLTTDAVAELKSENWTERYGDRRSELVFIGIKLDKSRIVKELGAALLTDEEFNVVDEKERKKRWADDLMPDEFFDGMPLWELGDVLGEEGDGEEDDDGGMCQLGGG